MARRRNEKRIASMLLWLKAAESDVPDLEDPEGLVDLVDSHPQLPEIEHDEWIRLVARFIREGGNPDKFSDDELARFMWIWDLRHEYRSLSMMKLYQVAAALFNNRLAYDQSLGERLNEKPITPSALQRAVARERKQFLLDLLVDKGPYVSKLSRAVIGRVLVSGIQEAINPESGEPPSLKTVDRILAEVEATYPKLLSLLFSQISAFEKSDKN